MKLAALDTPVLVITNVPMKVPAFGFISFAMASVIVHLVMMNGFAILIVLVIAFAMVIMLIVDIQT